jgi:hypothetical protein
MTFKRCLRGLEVRERENILTYYALSKYGVVPSKTALPFREQIMRSSRINKHNAVITIFINLPREYDTHDRPLCFETVVVQESTLDCRLERSYSLDIAEKIHDSCLEHLKQSITT